MPAPNFSTIGQHTAELLQHNHFQFELRLPPGFDQKWNIISSRLSKTCSDPYTKFQRNWTVHSWVINGATYFAHAIFGGVRGRTKEVRTCRRWV